MISRLIRTLVGILAVIAMLVIAFYAALYLWNRHIEASMRQRDGAERSDDMVASQMMGYVTRGRYDDAVRTGLEALRNEPRDAAIYQQLAMVYMSRARKEQGQREQWIREAVAYVGKAVSVDSNDPVNVLEAAHALAAAGGLSSEKRCPYYQRASELSEQMEPLYSGDHITIGGQSYPIEATRGEFTAAGHRFQIDTLEKENQKLSASLKGERANAGCK